MTATAQLPFRQDHPLRSSEQLRALQSDGPIHKVLTPVGDKAQQGPPADPHASLAQPFPVLVICDLLGVPYSERDRFRVWVEDAAVSADDTASLNGLAALLEYGLELVAVKRSEPGDDVISRLCEEPDLSDLEVATLGMQLLFAGHETTVMQIWLQSLLLLTHRDQWQTLLTSPALIPKAVEELLRAGMPGGIGVPRYAREDIDVDGVTIRAGDLVLLDPGSANHDPAAFPDPYRIDLARTGAAHVGFGYGMRYCVGAALARMGLKIVFSQLIPRFPTMRLCADASTMTAGFHSLSHGLVALPVTW